MIHHTGVRNYGGRQMFYRKSPTPVAMAQKSLACICLASSKTTHTIYEQPKNKGKKCADANPRPTSLCRKFTRDIATCWTSERGFYRFSSFLLRQQRDSPQPHDCVAAVDWVESVAVPCCSDSPSILPSIGHEARARSWQWIVGMLYTPEMLSPRSHVFFK